MNTRAVLFSPEPLLDLLSGVRTYPHYRQATAIFADSTLDAVAVPRKILFGICRAALPLRHALGPCGGHLGGGFLTGTPAHALLSLGIWPRRRATKTCEGRRPSGAACNLAL